jgi:Zn-dependent protease with chaperone function
MRVGASLAVRSVLVVALMILFYVAAIAACALLVGLALGSLALLVHTDNVRAMMLLIMLAGACVVAAAVVGWSVLPRLDRFEAPGPEATEREYPRLFAEIRAIAAATGQRMPAHVYLDTTVNAFVAQRGGIMGIGSRRVMGIGLPLLRALSVEQLHAVLAHEMGHFYGGDTRLGPWIYKTRAALMRTVVNLARVRQSNFEWVQLMFGIVQAPFRWFFVGYMRVSQAISRAQEYSADAVAVRTAGAQALIDGLKKTHAAGVAHSIYLHSEVLPLVRRGALPAVGEGFSRFLACPRFTGLVDEMVSRDIADEAADPFDSHPPLRERIAAASSMSQSTARRARPGASQPAIELIHDPERIETTAIASAVDSKLEPVRWDDATPIWIAAWRDRLKHARTILADVRIDGVALDIRSLQRRAARVGEDQIGDDSDDALRAWWTQTAGSALAVLLLEAGFATTAQIGEPFQFTRDGVTVEPFTELARHLAREISSIAWRDRWAELGFADRLLV